MHVCASPAPLPTRFDPQDRRRRPGPGAGSPTQSHSAAWVSAVLFGAILFLLSPAAQALPAFARKYQTSCTTCHTIFPKLNPFGEAFRRNGYRFPGVDADVIKQENFPLGGEAQKALFPGSVWPGILMGSVPLAMAFNGNATFHPDQNSSAAQADNGSVVSLHDLIAEGHLWGAGSFTEHITFFSQVTFSSANGLSLEEGYVLFNDLFGLKHALNLWVGKRAPTLTSFGNHSSYVSDNLFTSLSVTALYGATSSSWNVLDQEPSVEINGMFGGRFRYAVGVAAGANLDVRTAENVYAQIGIKLGGLRMDGEGEYQQQNPMRPWEETALSLDYFFSRSASHFSLPKGGPLDDTTYAYGANLRLQIHSLEINSGVYQERHDHAIPDGMTGSSVNALCQYDEISYIIFPWLVPAVRVEYVRLEPDSGGSSSNLRIIPGVAALVLPNLKFTLTGQIEYADGAPDAGWAPSGGSATPLPGLALGPEIESINVNLWFAF